MKRVQFWCVAKRPAKRGLPADEQDDHEGGEGGGGDHHRDPGAVDVEQRRFEREADERQEGERDEPAESLDDHGRERDVAGARRLRGPADPQHVATDGGRQHVAHELARQVVREERAHRHVHVEHREHPLPPPGREHEAGEGEEETEGEEQQGAGVGVLGLDVLGRDLGDEQGQERGTDDDPKRQLGGTRHAERAAGAACTSSLGSRHAAHVTGSFTGRFVRS